MGEALAAFQDLKMSDYGTSDGVLCFMFYTLAFIIKVSSGGWLANFFSLRSSMTSRCFILLFYNSKLHKRVTAIKISHATLSGHE